MLDLFHMTAEQFNELTPEEFDALPGYLAVDGYICEAISVTVRGADAADVIPLGAEAAGAVCTGPGEP